MTDDSTGWGFSTIVPRAGKPAEVKKPKVYDYNKGDEKRKVADEDLPQAPRKDAHPRTNLPKPEVLDFNRRR